MSPVLAHFGSNGVEPTMSAHWGNPDVALNTLNFASDPMRPSRLVSRRSRTLSALREHLTSGHEKSPLIACPNRGRRVAPEKPIVDALKPWLGGNLA
jgi:hypothetical protein